MVEDANNPDNGDGDGTGEGNVEYNGKKYDSHEDAAGKLMESQKEATRLYTEGQQKIGAQQQRIEDLEAENAALKEEKPPEDEKGKKKPTPTSEFDWEKPVESITEIAKSVSEEFATKIEESIAKIQETIEQGNLTREQRGEQKKIQEEITVAETDFPELKDEDGEPRKRVQGLLVDWRIADEKGEVLCRPPKHVLDKFAKDFPDVLKRARGNRVELAQYYLMMMDGTLEKHLKEATRAGTFTEGGGGKTPPPRSKKTDKEFFKLSEAEQAAEMKKESMGKKVPEIETEIEE